MLHLTPPRTIDVSSEIERLRSHPLYERLTDEAALRRFMATHVFCVWDFQCLLKALQRELTCVEPIWVPTPDPEARRLVNEIVLEEESDRMPDGSHLSHYEMYRLAMRAAGADEGPIDQFQRALGSGVSPEIALASESLPAGAAAFVSTTLAVARSGDAALIAGAFTYGREEAIPRMFTELVAMLADRDPSRWSGFRDYLERHIACDEEKHGPQARAVVARLCGDDEARWSRAESSAHEALQARIDLWDALARQ